MAAAFPRMSFEQAEKIAKSIPEPTASTVVELYSLRQQALVGDNQTARPDDPMEGLKWDTWKAKAGMSKEDAQAQFISLVEKFQERNMSL
ncbi:acyl-CoA-binding protein [Streptomyces sp. NPDC057011]|uniref:acyl-CoA-binding protein n=1 Tax=unclassified Streptomyces TaxID=2593676 RepID=UPI0036311A2E